MAKGVPWSHGLPVVSLPMGDAAQPVTLIYPYYQCSDFFTEQIRRWRDYPKELALSVCAIVVDDGSPEPMHLPADLPFPVRGFRIAVDVPWNWLAARNIGAHYAREGWLLLTDMDHVVPVETLRAVIYGRRDPSVVYAFSRREHTGQAVHPHSASFLMTRAMFWRIGGYDERLSGVYGTDGAYRKRLLATAPVQILDAELERHEYVSDASVTAYERKTPAMREARRQRFASLDPHGPIRVLSFPYHEVTAA